MHYLLECPLLLVIHVLLATNVPCYRLRMHCFTTRFPAIGSTLLPPVSPVICYAMSVPCYRLCVVCYKGSLLLVIVTDVSCY